MATPPHETRLINCEHDYEEVSSAYDMDGETYVCKKCGDRYRLYYDDMQ